MKQLFRGALVGFTLLLLAWLLVVTIQDRHDSGATLGIKAPNPIVGIWKGQHGNIIDLRPDGTMRGRSIDDSTNAIQYFKYRIHGDQFFLDYSAKPDEYLRRMRQAVLGMTVDNYGVAKLNNSELQLIDPVSGETYAFERIEDSVLFAAP